MIYASFFGYQPAVKTLTQVPDQATPDFMENAVIGFIHVEQKDSEDTGKVVTKLIKNLKWLAGKNNTQKIVLHSFSHLSESKGEPELVEHIFNHAEARLMESGYDVKQTPFGYFVDLELKAPGSPLARVFKDI